MKNGMYNYAKFGVEIYERIGDIGNTVIKITYDACPNEAFFVTDDKAELLFSQLKEILETASKED